jgi:hypothetical protein
LCREDTLTPQRPEVMWVQTPRAIVLLIAALALFVAGLVLAAYAAGWPRITGPVLMTPA